MSSSQDVTGFVLAGGQSSRMGQDKALLQLASETLLNRAIQSFRVAASEVLILGPATKFGAFGEVVEDIYPGQGPLAGIHAALRFSRTDRNLFLAVDMPLVPADFLVYLSQAAHASSAIVCLPRVKERYEPLCAVYRKAFLPLAERALAEGNNKIDLLFEDIELRVIDAAELQKNGFSPSIFGNLNGPEDWARAKAQFDNKPS